MMGLVYPLTMWGGLGGAATAVLLSVLVSLPFWVEKSVKILGERWFWIPRQVWHPVAASMIMIVVLCVTQLLLPEAGMILVVTKICIALSAYLLSICLLWYRLKDGPMQTLLEIRRNLA
jgi:peptidoglycan biosynthesis protein MviN/MurJ (putative lipid II flippase)